MHGTKWKGDLVIEETCDLRGREFESPRLLLPRCSYFYINLLVQISCLKRPKKRPKKTTILLFKFQIMHRHWAIRILRTLNLIKMASSAAPASASSSEVTDNILYMTLLHELKASFPAVSDDDVRRCISQVRASRTYQLTFTYYYL